MNCAGELRPRSPLDIISEMSGIMRTVEQLQLSHPFSAKYASSAVRRRTMSFAELH